MKLLLFVSLLLLTQERFLAPRCLFQVNTAFTDNLRAALPDERTEDLHYRWLYGIYSNLRHSGRDITDINTGEEDTIRLIATTYTKAAFEARTLLYLLHGEEYPVLMPPVPDIINPVLMQGVAVNFKNGQTNNLSSKIGKPYPNPANGTITLNVQLDKEDVATFSLFDVTGKLVYTTKLGNVQNTIDIAHLPHGMYFYQILLNGMASCNDKFLIIK